MHEKFTRYYGEVGSVGSVIILKSQENAKRVIMRILMFYCKNKEKTISTKIQYQIQEKFHKSFKTKTSEDYLA